MTTNNKPCIVCDINNEKNIYLNDIVGKMPLELLTNTIGLFIQKLPPVNNLSSTSDTDKNKSPYLTEISNTAENNNHTLIGNEYHILPTTRQIMPKCRRSHFNVGMQFTQAIIFCLRHHEYQTLTLKYGHEDVLIITNTNDDFKLNIEIDIARAERHIINKYLEEQKSKKFYRYFYIVMIFCWILITARLWL